MRRVVVGLGERDQHGLLDVALDEAMRRRLPLEVVHALPGAAYGDRLPPLEQLRPEAVARLREAVALACARVPGAATVDVSLRVVDDTRVRALVDAGQGAALVVLRRRPGRLRDSVCADVLLRCAAPVLLLPPDGARIADRGTASRVLVGLDGSPASQSALAWAVAQATEWGSVLVPVVVVGEGGVAPSGLAATRGEGPQALAAALWERVRAAGGQALEVHPETRVGRPVEQLLEVAGADDLLVLGSSGQALGRSLVVGSTSVRVAESCRAPVVVVRAGQTRRETRRSVGLATA